MSDKDRSKDDEGNGGGVGGGGGGDDEDGEERKISKGCSRRGKRVTFLRLRMGKKMMGERREEKGVYANSRCRWRRRSKIPECFLCLKEPETLDSSGLCNFQCSENVYQILTRPYSAKFTVLAAQREPQMRTVPTNGGENKFCSSAMKWLIGRL